MRYRYKLTEMLVQHPTQEASLRKSLPWAAILACLAAVAASAWYGWTYFGKKSASTAAPRPATSYPSEDA